MESNPREHLEFVRNLDISNEIYDAYSYENIVGKLVYVHATDSFHYHDYTVTPTQSLDLASANLEFCEEKVADYYLAKE